MGCERVRDAGNVGFGGVRASMERRWLINAKTTVMRQRKWQEIWLQQELEEQRKKAEILETRKRERARLSAYIHSTGQPPVKCVTNEKRQHNNNKRLNWKACLLRDQELLLKLRENAKAVVHNHPSKKGASNFDPEVQGHYTCRMTPCDSSLPVQAPIKPTRSDAQDLHSKKNPADSVLDSVQFLQVQKTYGEAVAQNQLLEKEIHGAYQMPQLPKTFPVRSEIGVNTSATWPIPNTIPSKPNFLEDQSPSMIQLNKWRSFTADNASDEHNGSQLDRSVLPNPGGLGPQSAATEVARCFQSMETNPEFASLEIASFGKVDFSTKKCSPDLKEEILKSRTVNEAATTRLIAQVTAIESRLDDCDMNWKSLCLQDDQIGISPATQPVQILGADVYPVHSNLVTNTNDHFSSLNKTLQENSITLSGMRIMTKDENFSKLAGQQSTQHVHKTGILSPPCPEFSNNISLDSRIVASSLVNGQSKISQKVEGEFATEGEQSFEQSFRNAATYSFHRESPKDQRTASSQGNKATNDRLVEQMKSPPECSSICQESERGLETLEHSGLVQSEKNNMECLSCPLKIANNDCDIVAVEEACTDSMKESHAAWKIDWNATTDLFPERNWEDHQSRQSNLGNINGGGEQNSHHSQLPHYEPIQHRLPYFSEYGCNQLGKVYSQDGKDGPRRPVENLTSASYLSAYETSGLVPEMVQISSNLESGHCFQNQCTGLDTNWTGAGFGASMLLENDKNYNIVGQHIQHSHIDKEIHLESQRQSLLEEEQKIFASLERLDWKLAAINIRSTNVGRESTVSRGQFSTRSAPAIMGPQSCTVMEHFSVSAKKVVPYSAIPPRPLTPQGVPIPRIPTGRQRCQVGLTNKAGRLHNLNRRNKDA